MASMSAQADAPVYIVHMNVGGEVDMLRYARERGVKVMGETARNIYSLRSMISSPRWREMDLFAADAHGKG